MIIFRREYTANVIDGNGELMGSVFACGRLCLEDAFQIMLNQKKEAEEAAGKGFYIVDVKRIS